MPPIITRRNYRPTTQEASGASFMRLCQHSDCTRSAGWRIELFPGHANFLCARHVADWQRIYGEALANWDPAALEGLPGAVGSQDDEFEVAA